MSVSDEPLFASTRKASDCVQDQGSTGSPGSVRKVKASPGNRENLRVGRTSIAIGLKVRWIPRSVATRMESTRGVSFAHLDYFEA